MAARASVTAMERELSRVQAKIAKRHGANEPSVLLPFERRDRLKPAGVPRWQIARE
jgi:hypothetical protein